MSQLTFVLGVEGTAGAEALVVLGAARAYHPLRMLHDHTWARCWCMPARYWASKTLGNF